MFAAEEHGTQEDRHRLIEGLDRGLGDRSDRTDDAGVVEHAIQTSVLRQGDGHRSFDVTLAGHICVVEDSVLAELRGQRLTGLVLDVGNNASRPFGDEAAHRALTDAAGPTGDDHHLAIEASSHCNPQFFRPLRTLHASRQRRVFPVGAPRQPRP